jgi:hypothetical protein
MSEIDMLRRIGEALYGEHWQSPLARDLAVAVRTVQRWAAGSRAIPASLWPQAECLLAARAREIAEIRRLLARAPHAAEGDGDAAV